MSWFNKSADIPTEEERYFASGSYQGTAAQTRRRKADSDRRYRQEQAAQQRAEATRRRHSVVRKAGTLRQDRNGTLYMDGWDFNAAPGVPSQRIDAELVYGSNDNRVAGLSIEDLHAMAEGHGPNCQCGIGR